MIRKLDFLLKIKTFYFIHNDSDGKTFLKKGQKKEKNLFKNIIY